MIEHVRRFCAVPSMWEWECLCEDLFASVSISCKRAASLLMAAWTILRGRMKIYATGTVAYKSPRTALYVTPGNNPESDPEEWFEDETRQKRKQFKVEFVFGEAEVPDTLGKWLLAQGAAKRTRLFVPTGPVAA
jgi:hypothetical protein